MPADTDEQTTTDASHARQLYESVRPVTLAAVLAELTAANSAERESLGRGSGCCGGSALLSEVLAAPLPLHSATSVLCACRLPLLTDSVGGTAAARAADTSAAATVPAS